MKFGIRELIFLNLMIGLVAAAYFFVFKPAFDKRQTLVNDTISKRSALANLRSSTAGIKDLGKRIDDLQQAITFFEGKLPKEQDMDEVLRKVTEGAKKNSLDTRTFKPGKKEQAASYCEMPIEIRLAGDFSGFYTFLLQLENLPRITRLTQMKLEKISERDGEMSASLTLSIFFVPDPSRGATAAAN